MGKYSHYSDIDPDFKAIQAIAAEMADGLFNLPMPQRRAAFAAAPPAPEDLPENLNIHDDDFPAQDGTRIPIRIYKSPDAKPGATLFYVMHGGGWTIGGVSTEETMQRYVADRNKAVVVSVDYRMGPENKYPHAVNDSFDGLKWCISNADTLEINPKKIVVGGSSAGGNLAAVMALKARDEGLQGIIGQVLNIPVTCHPQVFPKDKFNYYESWDQNKDSVPLTAQRMMWFWDQYLGDKVEPDAYHSPLLAASLEGLPPALLQVGGMDPLRDEAIAYADLLEAARVKTKLELFPGVPHGFGDMIMLKQSKTYNDNIVAFVNEVQSGADLGAKT